MGKDIRAVGQGKGLPKSAEHRAKISRALTGKKKSPEHVAAIAKASFKTGIRPDYYRRIAFEAHGDKCQRCGSSAYIRVHHKDRNRHNNIAENLEVLCQSCHSKEHGAGGDVRNTTHCPQGHEYSPENTYVWNNSRACRECNRIKNRAWYARKKGTQDV